MRCGCWCRDDTRIDRLLWNNQGLWKNSRYARLRNGGRAFHSSLPRRALCSISLAHFGEALLDIEIDLLVLDEVSVSFAGQVQELALASDGVSA
jgi:hypothetical protein